MIEEANCQKSLSTLAESVEIALFVGYEDWMSIGVLALSLIKLMKFENLK